MTLQDFAKLIQNLAIPIAYYQFKSAQTLPFAVYYNPSDNVLRADNKVLYKTRNVTFEVYTNSKDIALEGRIEQLFNEHEIYYDNPTDVFIESENVWQRTYNIIL
ncbi:hypothetical protein QN089_05620 [Kurthia sp. YJT4]|uniref:hypothetical protein n=1 Tax=Kurthia sp. YJT4 TaxID=3049086 RepID=UPI00254A47EB|nr:hypothetical protein [Kurthia sp. YJT4]WIL39747.1 hypothetical protein QN089_05620 [Kurthia sp. YJT4]